MLHCWARLLAEFLGWEGLPAASHSEWTRHCALQSGRLAVQFPLSGEPQAMLHDWVGSLAGFAAWTRLQAVLSTWAEHQVGLCCEVGL